MCEATDKDEFPAETERQRKVSEYGLLVLCVFMCVCGFASTSSCLSILLASSVLLNACEEEHEDIDDA